MATKYQRITGIYESTINKVTDNPAEWTAFLRSACRNYKCRFDEQILIYAQRPNATAVLEMEKWNKQFGRWVNRGATGIAVLDDEHDGNYRLKHYFDISDTHESQFSRPVPLWSVEPEYEDDVIESLENSFGELDDKATLADAIVSAARNAVEDNMADYLVDLMNCRDGSILEQFDEEYITNEFRFALHRSVAYMVLTRCGIDADYYLSDFRPIINFNTPNTVNALGIATSDIAENCLLEISTTVRSLQRAAHQDVIMVRESQPETSQSMERELPAGATRRELPAGAARRTFAKPETPAHNIPIKQNDERGADNGTDISHGGRLPRTESDRTGGTARNRQAGLWQIRITPKEISETAPPHTIRESADIGQAERTSDGNRADSEQLHGADNRRDGGDTRRDGADESRESDAMGGPDEQHTAISGGNDTPRPDLQLNTEQKAGSAELPAFVDETLVMGIVANPNDDLAQTKGQIEAFFANRADKSERAEYMKSVYQDRYTETDVDGKRVGYKPQSDGLLMWEGAYLSRTAESVFSWDLVAEFTAELIDKKEYYIDTNITRIKPLTPFVEQLNMFGETEESAKGNKPAPTSSAFSISQQIIDEVLTSGGNEIDSIHRIAAYFKKDHTNIENADFLMNEYHNGGKGFVFGGSRISAWFNDSGIRIAVGDTAQNADNSTLVTWEQAARRTRELLDMGRYMPQKELDKVDGIEIKSLADNLWDTNQDLADDYEFSFLDKELFKHGFPDSTARIAELLAQPEERQDIIAGLWDFANEYRQNPKLLRFRFAANRLYKLLNGLDDLEREPLVFTADESVSSARPSFITQDEVDKALADGSSFSEGKYRIYSYFLQDRTAKEKTDFLKHEYGTGGSSRTGHSEWHDSKGIAYSRENNHMPYDKVILSWSKVTSRIDELIADGKYMSQRELDYIPEYEKGELAQEIYLFFQNKPEDVPHPYPANVYYHDAVKAIRPQLDAPERIAEILNNMAAVLDNTADFARDYESMRKAFDNLTAYQNGTFSLFTPADKPTKQAQARPATPKKAAAPAPAPSPTADPAAEYDLQLGATVYLGVEEFEIYSFDNANIVLRDANAPLYMLDMPRDIFDRKLRENRLNDGLIKTESTQEVTPSESPATEPEQRTPKAGERYKIQDRLYLVDYVDLDYDKVSLRDITFENSKGFPIFRSESLDFIRQYDPIQPKQPHEEVSGLRSIVIDLRPTAQEIEPPQTTPPTEPVWEKVEGGEVTKVRIDLSPDQPAEQEETLTPAWEKPKPRSRTQTFDAHPEIPQSERHNFVITDDALGHGGAKTKFRNNVEAIKTLQTIEVENRFATPEEQEILSRYVGWGSLADAFDERKPTWTNEYVMLKSLLSPEDYASARATTLNAHYTSPTVIKAIYKTIENMGFKTGNILDPGCGIGNFQGLLPESMNNSKVFGVELDPTTGKIARQLYQKNSIAIQGYEKTELPDSFFDLSIGNVPFGDISVLDKRYDKHKFHIHDFFFAKTLDKVRPGGVIAFVTSKYTMDKKNPTVRKYIAQRADLLGAIRLPCDAFLANAGTEVTADIIFLQKRDRITDIEPDWVHLGETDDGIPVNSYFAEHPDMILGTMSNDTGIRMYGAANSTSCVPFPDADLSEQLADAITNIHAEISDYERGEDEPEEDNSIPADPNVRNFSYTLVDGQIYYRQDSRMIPAQLPATTQSRVKGMIKLRECVRDLIMFQTERYPDSDIKAEQAKLNRLYDDFTRKYGLINSRGNNIAFSQDSAYCLLCSLEIIDENGELERKADMFSKRTIKPHEPVTHVDTASEALSVSMSEKARVDLPYMTALTGMSEDALIKELEGVIFLNIGSMDSTDNVYVTADEYLSGNVREKLKMAQAAQKTFPDGRYDVNVKALEAALPEDLSAGDISVRLGATWLPEDMIQKFMYELLQTSGYARERIKLHYYRLNGEWNITEKNADRSNIHVFNTYGTTRMNAYKIIEESLNLRDVRIFDPDPNDDKKRILNKKETAIAQAKQEIIRTKFGEWIWKDPQRRERLCRLYNDKFNSIRPREYDGSHIHFPGMNPEISLRKHQTDAIAHILYGGNTLLAHEVGAGKTYEMVAAAMESKRLGLCNKSLIVVPNHITEQWAAEFLQLYPSANILVATKKDFETKNRKKFCARIATGDYDAIIIGHSQFEKIPMSAERQQAMMVRQIDELVDGIDEIKRNNGEKFTIKQMEKMKKNLENKLSKLNDQSKKDDVVNFEELGIDRLFIDEAHYYKNLFLITKMRNVAGIAQTEAQKSSDLFMKCQYLDELTDGRGTVFATGTPISNSMVELYTMQRYLQYESLVRNDLQHFDAWASTFGETVTAIELAPEGTGYRAKTRFAKFYNLPELMSMFRMVADIQTADMLDLPVPKANFHTEVIKPSDWQTEMVADLAERAAAIRDRKVEPHIDNMLKVTNDGRKLALDQRLMNPMLPDEPDGKASMCANNVYRIWDETRENRSAQLVFCDLSTPKKALAMEEIDGVQQATEFQNVYVDIRKKLIDKGLPENEIAFIHDADTEAKKKELFAKVRKGQVRVLMGSTQKMGAGTNVQDRLIALHDMDCPWRPADLAQRLGRIVRQGNKNPDVEIFRYVTESTFDSYLYQLVENKQKFIAQIMTSKTPVRSAEDVDETALSYAEIKALATGNPHIIEKCQLEMDVGRLKILHASHLNQRYALEDKILKEYPQETKRLTERIAGYTADISTVAQHPANKDYFPPMTVGRNIYAEKKEAGNAIIEACKAMSSPDPVALGQYRGFPMILSFETHSKEYRITLSGALSHTVSLGTDIHGNITRLDNKLEEFAGALGHCERQLADVQTQMETAKGELDRPFVQQQEFNEKSERLNELNILLNMDEKDNSILDYGPDEGEPEPPPKQQARER